MLKRIPYPEYMTGIQSNAHRLPHMQTESPIPPRELERFPAPSEQDKSISIHEVKERFIPCAFNMALKDYKPKIPKRKQ